MNKIRQIKVPCIKLTEFKRENSNLIDTSEYKFLLGALFVYSCQNQT